MSDAFDTRRRGERRHVDPRDKRDMKLKEMRRARAQQEQEKEEREERRLARKNSRAEQRQQRAAVGDDGKDSDMRKWNSASVRDQQPPALAQKWSSKTIIRADDNSRSSAFGGGGRYRKSSSQDESEDEDDDEEEDEDEDEYEDEDEDGDDFEDVQKGRNKKDELKKSGKDGDDEGDDDDDEEVQDEELDPDIVRKVKFLLCEEEEEEEDEEDKEEEYKEKRKQVKDAAGSDTESVGSKSSASRKNTGTVVDEEKRKKQLKKDFNKYKKQTIDKIQALEKGIKTGSGKQKNAHRRELSKLMEEFQIREKEHFKEMNPHLADFSDDSDLEDEAKQSFSSSSASSKAKQRSASWKGPSTSYEGLSQRAAQAIASGDDEGYATLLDKLRIAHQNLDKKAHTLDDFDKISKRINLYNFQIDEAYFHLPPHKRSPPEPIVSAADYFRRDHFPRALKLNKEITRAFNNLPEEDRLYYIRRSKIDKMRYEVQSLEYKLLQQKQKK